MWVTVALEGGLKEKKKYVHLLILIWNGCWLWAFCVSWKQLGKADVWVHRFSTQGLTLSWREWICYDGHKHLRWWRQRSLCGVGGAGRRLGALLQCDCFCFSGSNVSCNQLGMRVYLAKLWSGVPQQMCLLVFRSRGVKIIEGTNVIYQLVRNSCRSMNLWLCGTFFVWLSGPLRLKVFPPVGFQHTWRFGTHKILKKSFMISR